MLSVRAILAADHIVHQGTQIVHYYCCTIILLLLLLVAFSLFGVFLGVSIVYKAFFKSLPIKIKI